jgi:hypothetical protein
VGSVGSVGVVGAAGARGCGDGTVRCAVGLRCCGGVPYPREGVCATDCPLKSDRAIKERLANVDERAVLEKLVNLHVTEWSYRGERDVRHVGPMAQDFRAAFGLGSGDRSIHPVDANGVAVVAIQALHARLVALEAEVKELRHENDTLRARRAKRSVRASRSESDIPKAR